MVPVCYIISLLYNRIIIFDASTQLFNVVVDWNGAIYAILFHKNVVYFIDDVLGVKRSLP